MHARGRVEVNIRKAAAQTWPLRTLQFNGEVPDRGQADVRGKNYLRDSGARTVTPERDQGPGDVPFPEQSG